MKQLKALLDNSRVEYTEVRIIAETDIEIKRNDGKYVLGYFSNGGYALLPPTFKPYKVSDTPFTDSDVLGYYQAKTAHEALKS
jgi:hypothetical protein